MAALRLASISKQLREVRIHLCQTSSSSLGVRNFIENHYVSLKKENPDMPFLVRECSGIEPKMTARFDFGLEKSVSLSDQDSSQVLKSLENLAKNA
ncbi:NADH dehydrogenase [ubiquinone] 1 alpha subcomplex subunit 2-like [Clytia hemisphaerica]|uniref:NADH dehydrogenase [ubiquinone] 1 alpha subcomplex subunit 2-like n=1 Tax=Clytia hemisphaerica TaxID=252671 RepID=UPI0034D5D061